MFYDPASFQGSLDRRGYFEGWYFKLVDKDGQRPIALIPGISLAEKDPHAFIQLLDGGSGKSAYYRYPIADFKAEANKFAIRIGDNHFNGEGIDLDLFDPQSLVPGAGYQVSGKVAFGPLKPWPVTLFSPGAMGPFAFLPKMECCH
ncbi:MAG TPA: hypothetical protein VMT55_00825, partial [Candidatus Sulfotelmatobacter sp.]|nr:hypothetical protein [Candidatus Sulfotelmatobacter sp.]